VQNTGKRILVLEDDEHLRQLIVETLEDEGYLVESASNGATAVEMSGTWKFHLLLTDVRIPGKMDGVAALEEIRRAQPDLRSIIMTGYADSGVPGRAMKLCADDYLLKGSPTFGMHSLLESVRKTLALTERGNLFSVLWSRLGEGRKNTLKERSLSLYTLRYQVFGQFFVAIRSNALSAEQYSTVWKHLGELDSRLTKLNSESEIHALEADYTTQATALHSASVRPGPTTRLFDRILADVKEGLLDSDALGLLSLMGTATELARRDVESNLLYNKYLGSEAMSQAELAT
jgi:CheY-like chemotaxis protein